MNVLKTKGPPKPPTKTCFTVKLTWNGLKDTFKPSLNLVSCFLVVQQRLDILLDKQGLIDNLLDKQELHF